LTPAWPGSSTNEKCHYNQLTREGGAGDALRVSHPADVHCGAHSAAQTHWLQTDKQTSSTSRRTGAASVALLPRRLSRLAAFATDARSSAGSSALACVSKNRGDVAPCGSRAGGGSITSEAPAAAGDSLAAGGPGAAAAAAADGGTTVGGATARTGSIRDADGREGDDGCGGGGGTNRSGSSGPLRAPSASAALPGRASASRRTPRGPPRAARARDGVTGCGTAGAGSSATASAGCCMCAVGAGCACWASSASKASARCDSGCSASAASASARADSAGFMDAGNESGGRNLPCAAHCTRRRHTPLGQQSAGAVPPGATRATRPGCAQPGPPQHRPCARGQGPLCTARSEYHRSGANTCKPRAHGE
jgi:hypothetical protein